MLQTANPSLSANNAAEKMIELFKVVHKTLRELFNEEARQYGLTLPQVWVILALHKKPYQNLLELSEILGLSKSTVSELINRLVVQGIVIREIPEDNRRTVKLSLSPQFTKINDLVEIRKQFFARIIGTASAEEVESINTGLEILLRILKLMNNTKEDTGQKNCNQP